MIDACFQHAIAVSQWVFWPGIACLFALQAVLLKGDLRLAFLHLIGRSRQKTPIWVKTLGYGVSVAALVTFVVASGTCR